MVFRIIGWAIALVVIGLLVGILALAGIIAVAGLEILGGIVLVVGILLAIAYFAGRRREPTARRTSR